MPDRRRRSNYAVISNELITSPFRVKGTEANAVLYSKTVST
jgi:hypothetical protein